MLNAILPRRAARASAGLSILCLTVLAAIGSPGTGPPTSAEPARETARRLSAGLIGSKHDFTADGRFGRDLCLPCHTPHVPGAVRPRLDRRAAATQPIRPYQTPGVVLNDASLLCLSCHDGIIAPDVFDGAHALGWGELEARSFVPVNRLTSHPIGIRYPVNDPRFEPAERVTADGRIKLPDGRVQCTSCHDPHNTGRHEGMLRKSNRRSRLCLSCHRI